MSMNAYEKVPNDPDVEESSLLSHSTSIPLSDHHTSSHPALKKNSTYIDEVLSTSVFHNFNRDAMLLFIGKAIRMFSFGFLAVMLVVYLTEIGFSMKDIGMMFTWTLLGDTIVSLLLTSHADRFGRRLCLLASAFLTLITSIAFATQQNFTILLISSIIGVISPSGGEIGPFISIELSSLAQITEPKDRTMLLAWYNLCGCFASAIGGLGCGAIMSYLQNNHDYTPLQSCQAVLCIYAALQGLLFMVFYMISSAVEVPDHTTATIKAANPVSLFMGLHKSKRIVLQLSILFMIDSFAGAFVLQSVISNWFYDTYHTPPKTLGTIIFICNMLAGISALFAAKLASNIGLVLTMVVTHLPSNVLLILVPLMSTEMTAIAILCARYSISQMDVPTRNAYVQSVVDPDERSAASGVTNVVRSLGASTAPLLAGMLYANPSYRNYPFYIAGVLKICYDLMLLESFRNVVGDEFQKE